MNPFRNPGACFLSRRKLLALVSALAVLTISGWWWSRGNPAPLLWSDIREEDGALLSLAAGRDLARNDFPNHAALTPSGGLVIGGDPAEDTRQWQIRVW